MSATYTYSQSETFTVTHARHIAAKVATDLLRFQRFHGKPATDMIDAYEEELVALLKEDYLDTVTYGYQRGGRWVAGAALRYQAIGGGGLVADDDPGRIRPDADIAGATFCSFLTHNSRWSALSESQRDRFKEGLPFQRTSGSEPGVENGYWATDRTYSAGGRGVTRSTIRRF